MIKPHIMRGIALLLLLAGCASKPIQFARIDGAIPNQAQFAADETACQGELAKAQMMATDHILGAGRTVFIGCMAGKGYVQAAQ